jgi:hypothetical protein
MAEDLLATAAVEEAMVPLTAAGIMEELGLEDTLAEVLTQMVTVVLVV